MSDNKPEPTKKYFFFDIDGTLIPESVSAECKIPESTVRAIDQLEKRGHFCAIATGRMHCMGMEQAEKLGFNNLVADGGHSVVVNGEMIGEIEPLPYDTCIELIRECEERGLVWGVTWEDDPVRVTPYPEFARLTDDDYQRSVVKEDLKVEDIPRFLKVYVACSPEEEAYLPALKELPSMRYDDRFTYIEPMEKEKGIMRMRDYLGVSDDDIVVFGDAKNDLSMFRPEWLCIAMGNAIPELKEKADFVTLNSADDGIAYALRHFGWID